MWLARLFILSVLTVPLFEEPLQVVLKHNYFDGKAVVPFSVILVALASLRLILSLYLLVYFYKSGAYLIDNLRDEDRPGRTCRQKAFVVILSLYLVIATLHANIFLPFSYVNPYWLQIDCPKWYTASHQVLKLCSAFLIFTLVITFDLLVFYFIWINSGNNEENQQ